MEDSISVSYANAVNLQFQKLSLQGITFVTGSGDWGVGCLDSICSRFTPDFPSSSPYVTSLGGTFINEKNIEVSVDFSSGGFSEIFERPSFQENVVQQYLKTPSVKLLEGFFNSGGRAFPDLSTVSTNFMVFVNGSMIPVSGTSAATPTFAAMVTILNNERMSRGMSTMGWINPFLYESYESNHKTFTDITDGQQQMQGCCGKSFSPIKGWDAVTGLGSPVFSELLYFALNPNQIK